MVAMGAATPPPVCEGGGARPSRSRWLCSSAASACPLCPGTPARTRAERELPTDDLAATLDAVAPTDLLDERQDVHLLLQRAAGQRDVKLPQPLVLAERRAVRCPQRTCGGTRTSASTRRS